MHIRYLLIAFLLPLFLYGCGGGGGGGAPAPVSTPTIAPCVLDSSVVGNCKLG